MAKNRNNSMISYLIHKRESHLSPLTKLNSKLRLLKSSKIKCNKFLSKKIVKKSEGNFS